MGHLSCKDWLALDNEALFRHVPHDGSLEDFENRATCANTR